MEHQTVEDALKEWLARHSIGRRARTIEFNTEIVTTLIAALGDKGKVCPQSLTLTDILDVGQALGHYCPSRWNQFVAALRSITPHAQALQRRKLRLKEFTPPDQATFDALLAQCDAMPRSKAGIVIRFLALTGLRITEARSIKWSNVFDDRIEVPAEVAKGARKRSVPRLGGLDDVLSRLKALKTKGDFVLPRETPKLAIAKACRELGLPRMSFHSFRHLFATRSIQAGVDIPTVARWLGHQDGGALASKTYYHLVDDHSRTMAAKVKIL